MLTKMIQNLKCRIVDEDIITGWSTLQPLESLVWKRTEIPEPILNSSFLMRWLCDSFSHELPEDVIIEESASWTASPSEDELIFHPVLYAPI